MLKTTRSRGALAAAAGIALVIAALFAALTVSGIGAWSPSHADTFTTRPTHVVSVVLNGDDCDQCTEQVQRWYPDGSMQRVTSWDDGSYTDERWETDHTYTRTLTQNGQTTTTSDTWSK